MKKYFRIGEISKLYHIGPDSLRYYEELGILTPKRGENGYRLYCIDDIWRLNVIRDLRELGFSMERIQKYLENRTLDITQQLLQEELEIIQQRMETLSILRKNVNQRLEMIRQAKESAINEVVEKNISDRFCHWIPQGYEKDEEMDVLIKQLMNYNPEKLYIVGSNHVGSMIPLFSALKCKFRDYQAVFMIDEDGDHLIEGGKYLSISYHGDCEQNKTYLPKLFEYAKQYGYQPAGDVLELLWVDIHVSEHICEHINELQIRVVRQDKCGFSKL